MRTATRNLVVAVLLFALAVAIDFVAINSDRVEVELFVILPLSLLMYLVVPLSFWWANRDLFATHRNGEFLRVLVALAASVIFAALAFLPYLEIHALLGGRT